MKAHTRWFTQNTKPYTRCYTKWFHFQKFIWVCYVSHHKTKYLEKAMDEVMAEKIEWAWLIRFTAHAGCEFYCETLKLLLQAKPTVIGTRWQFYIFSDFHFSNLGKVSILILLIIHSFCSKTRIHSLTLSLQDHVGQIINSDQPRFRNNQQPKIYLIIL